MYFPLMHEFMKLTEMINRVVIFVFSKYGQKIAPFIDSRNNIWKTKNNREIERSKPLGQNGFHLKIWLLKTVESPLDSLNMESPGEWSIVWMCLVFVHHQRSDLIIVVLPGKYISLLRSLATTPEDVGPKVCTWLLKGKDRPPQVLEWFAFNKFGLLVSWRVGFTKTKTWLGWQGDMIIGPPWLVAHKW